MATSIRALERTTKQNNHSLIFFGIVDRYELRS